MSRLSIIFAFIIILVIACDNSVPLKTKSDENTCLSFDISKFGEYSTKVDLLEISDEQSSEVIVSVKPRNGEFVRLIKFTLCPGENVQVFEKYLEDDVLQYSVPTGGKSFTLVTGKYYSLKIVSSEYPQPSVTTFRF